jgi:putative endonuclease
VGKRETGILGETLACEALARRGYEIVARGWRCARGEVDIVARDGGYWVFVEVKTRHGHGAGSPEEALTAQKATRLRELAEIYLAEHGLQNVDWRIDLVALDLDAHNGIRRLNLLPGVVID